MTKVAKIEPTEIAETNPIISMIERVAMDPNVPVENLERMLDLKARHDAQQAKMAFDRAFSLASASFPDIPQNGHNSHSGQSYSTLKDILKSTRPILAQHGLALSFSTESDKESVTVTAELSHEGGHSKRNGLPLPRDTGPGRNSVQAVGSTQTYGQRYTAQAILGLSLGEDTEDDGRTSGKVQDQPARKTYSWAGSITDELPDTATLRDKAEAITVAICTQFKRMKGVKQLFNEWDRRASLTESMEQKHEDLHHEIVEAYDVRMMELTDAAAEKKGDLAGQGHP